MKKILFSAAFILLFGVIASTALAGGGQNVGEKGNGEVSQHQINCESPWLCPDSVE